jgi:hypothetical protein
MEVNLRKVSMKAFSVIAIYATAAGLSLAQTAATARPPHGLVTLKLTWSREISPPRAVVPRRDEVSGPAHPNNPYDDPVDKLRAQSPAPSSPLPVQGRLPYLYVYSLKVRNEGGKKIRGVFWEYVATDRDSGAELNRRRFISLQEVGPAEVATLRAEYPSPPTYLVTPGGLGKDERSPFTSSAEIRCVLYADATVWEADGGQKDCTELRQADAQTHRQKGRQP